MGLNYGLGSLPLLTHAKTRSISAENPTGEKGGGAKAENHLGVGWKGRAFLDLKDGTTTPLAEIDGPGVIQHIWITLPEKTEKPGHPLRDLVLRVYWDGEATPSIEAPLGDFFANGHGLRCAINSVPVSVNSIGGFNCYWPMPFRKSAKITVENQHEGEVPGFYYQVDYALTEVAESAAYFHAQWRRENPVEFQKEYTLLDGVTGQGHYVGSYFAWAQLSDGWWGEGEIKFFMDGNTEFPTLCGTGTEDYIGGAWGFEGGTFSAPYLGYSLFHKEPGQIIQHGLYRWHVLDSIRFESDLRVTIQDLGWSKRGLWPLTDDISSVAYWYQAEPHGAFPALPEAQYRWPR